MIKISNYLANKGLRTLTPVNRAKIIKIVQDFIEGDDFEYYYDKWYCEDGSDLKKEQIKKIYTPLGYMKKIVQEMVLLSPILENFTTVKEKKIRLCKDFLIENQWESLLSEIFLTLETCGDFFAYWYYPEDSKIPKIKVLESENVHDIILDSEGNMKALIYKETVIDEKFDAKTALITDKYSYEISMVFEKGKITVNDPVKYKSGSKVFPNEPHEKDLIRLIHIPSFKKQKDKFSQIPATDYIDLILHLNAISTDIRFGNRLLTFPIAWLRDGEIDWDNSSMMPGGKVEYTSKRGISETIVGDVKFQEINNRLDPIKEERLTTESSLYKMSGLIRERLEEILGRSDSSKVIAQLRLTLENKFQKYCKNIANGFKPIFTSLLKVSNLYNKSDKITFAMPDQFISTSVLEQLEILNAKIAVGKTTMQEEWDKEGLSDVDKKQRVTNINEEIIMGKDDISINKGEIDMDNKLKQQKLDI